MRLYTKDLVKRYKARTVVDHVSIEVNQGEIVGLLGPNGAGKTTTFYMIVGLIKPNEGQIFLEDQEITKEPVYKRAQKGVGYLAQEASVFRRLSVEDNIKAVLQMTDFPKDYQAERLENLIEEFRLTKVRKSLGIQLSGGERRRTEIARAVAINPKFILLDEPFAGVDPIAVEDIQSIVATLKNKNIGVIITDHNVHETLSITDRTYLLFEGRILKAGSAEDLANDEMVRKVYLGQDFKLRGGSMDKTIRRSRAEGSVTAPSSKSYAQRAVAAALLCEGTSTLTNMILCDDTRAALQVAADLGAEVEAGTDGTTYTIRGGLRPHAQAIHIGESGLAARLFTPIAALCGERITITGRGSILRRPLAMMEKPLRTLGAKVTSEGGYLPIRIEGPLHGGAVSVDGSLSSQFITGLLMALPLAERDTTLTVHNLKSRPYIDMTLSLLGTFGIDVKHNEYRQFFIEGRQRYAPAQYNVEGDWSGASCLLVAGATTGEVTVRNLNPVSLQADMAIVDALTRAGAQITTTTDSVTVRRSPLHAFEFDATHCPDLFPALAALAASCQGTSTLRGTRRLAHKESDRARTIADVLESMGINVDLSTPDVMRVTGGEIRGAEVSSHNDHRIAMAAAVAALRCGQGSVTIRGAEAVAKSYPEFWDDLSGLLRPDEHGHNEKTTI